MRMASMPSIRISSRVLPGRARFVAVRQRGAIGLGVMPAGWRVVLS